VKEDDGELPLWDIDHAGLQCFDATKAIATGLRHRPLAETIADTLAWDRGRGALKAGLTPERERALLHEWKMTEW
jgi:2'-hydroxyisoflavone reductase